MAVSKHNLWKRKKNGVMKLVRSHGEWLERRCKTRVRKINVVAEKKQWWEKENPVESPKKGLMMSDGSSSPTTKRTQVGKKV